MKTLPNGNKAFYRQGGVWSLLAGIGLFICMVVAYFTVPFQVGERWIYYFMAAPFAVLVVILLKNFFLPTAVFIASTQGIEFYAMNKLFGNPVKVVWNQITTIAYNTRMVGFSKHTGITEVLVFHLEKDITYEFNLLAINHKSREQLYRIFRKKGLKVRKF